MAVLDMSQYYSLPLPAAIREDFIETYGWDSLVSELGERQGMQDAYNAIEFAAPKGSAGKLYTLRLHKALATVLVPMLEVRWADHFSAQSDLEPGYDRLLSKVREVRDKARKR